MLKPLLLEDENVSKVSMLSYMLPFIEDKGLAVDYLYTQIQEILFTLVTEYDEFVDGIKMMEAEEGIDFFNKQSYFN